MELSKEKIEIFKPYLKPSNLYVGGKTRAEVEGIAGGNKIYKMSSNENLLGASPKALQAILDNVQGLHEYPDRSDQRLQVALEQFYKGEIKAGQFLTANSGSEMLEMIIRAFLGEGLEYIVSNPMFKPYQMFSDKMGAVMVDVPLTDPDYALNIEGMLDAVNDQTRMLFLTSPNNPTGTYIPKDQLTYLLDSLPDHVIVVLDEVYNLFADADDYTTAVPFVKEGRRIIGLNSFSKSFGLAGMRLGYAYASPELAEYVQRLYKPFPFSSLGLAAAEAALSDHDFLERVGSLVKSERQYLYEGLDRLGMHYWKSQGNFIMMRPTLSKNMTSDKEFEQKMLEQGVMVRPVTGFGAPGCVRVTVGQREANDAFLAALEGIGV